MGRSITPKTRFPSGSPAGKALPEFSLIDADPFLKPFASVLARRRQRVREQAEELARRHGSLLESAAAHRYFGLHLEGDGWVLREWAPHATGICIIGEGSGWQERPENELERIHEDGIWEIRLPREALTHQRLYRLRIRWPGGGGDRIPAYARRVVQDPHTLLFNAQVWQPPEPYRWRAEGFTPGFRAPLIYEAHVGMAQEAARIGTYAEFARRIIPRIKAAGYNTIQLMAIKEHPFYGSFGYQVASFFAPSSRFGTPCELKALIDTAHENGLAVIMDLVHSHAVANEVEGLGRFDGTGYQYFHDGGRGRHPVWDSRLFDYGKPRVLEFLLSNCRYWLEEFRLDGFRFDGITSMLYLHRGLGKAFTSYDDYFGEEVDEDALCYLTLANRVIRETRPEAITIAEDVSGMPGLAAPIDRGGAGFDFRFAMGVPDLWTRLVKEVRDEDWPLGHLWHELTNRRPEEKTISYAESHDQALVGDQTLIFRLIGSDMYTHMHETDSHLGVDRGMALHKLIRLITLATAGHGYLNFMGNEFGHPEWIDFPREGNGFSCHYARRQWRLRDHPELKYRFLARFDRDMLALAADHRFLEGAPVCLLHEHHDNQILAFERGGLVFAFNFHPTRSYPDYAFGTPPGKYRMILDSDAAAYGGHGRLTPDQVHFTRRIAVGPGGPPANRLSLYLPTRTALVLAPAGDQSPSTCLRDRRHSLARSA